MLHATFESYDRLSEVLKGSGIADTLVRSDWDLIDLSKKGLRKSVLGTIAAQLGISLTDTAALLGMSLKEYNEKTDDELFTTRHSEHILKLAELISRGKELWGEEQDKFKAWLQEDIPSLGGKKPVELLDTILGIEMVITLISRIIQGVHS
jgi:putative toxin-antitoxin system antitoxin component (TIGR02293 family)